MLDNTTEGTAAEKRLLDGAATVLIIDDSVISRNKIALAVRHLGYHADVADSGAAGLKALHDKAYDAILLDIVMPEMDGFAVLGELKKHPQLRDIPVVVISTLEDETGSVIKAIRLGADDFLPKNFDPELLDARLSTLLAKKRFLDQEREYFRRIEQLTEAAEVLESGRFDAQSLALDELAQRKDPLGRLAAVFQGMAGEIYERELRLRRRVQILQGSFLVLAVGIVWGLTPALARMASTMGSNPLGLAVWVNSVAAIFCLSIAYQRGKLPTLNWQQALFFLGWAIIAGVLQRLTTFWVTEHVQAATLSLIVTLQGFIVFAFAATIKLEKATPRRLIGLIVGLLGVIAVLFSRFETMAAGEHAWLIIALLLPLFFALETVYLAAKRPREIDLFASVGFMMLFSALLLAPLAYLQGDLMLSHGIGRLEILMVFMGIVGASSVLLALHLIATAGAVFSSQSAYAMTLAGIVWGMLLLNEALSTIMWVALTLILIGLYLVEPTASDDKIILKRSFVNRSE